MLVGVGPDVVSVVDVVIAPDLLYHEGGLGARVHHDLAEWVVAGALDDIEADRFERGLLKTGWL
jgi:hypothetical protein